MEPKPTPSDALRPTTPCTFAGCDLPAVAVWVNEAHTVRLDACVQCDADLQHDLETGHADPCTPEPMFRAPEYVVCADCERGVPAFIECATTVQDGCAGVWADCPACNVTGIDADSDRCDACGERVDPVDGCDCVDCAACGDRIPLHESEAFPEDPHATVLEPWCADCMDMATSHLCDPVSRQPFPCYGCDDVDADRWGDVGGGADVPACGRCTAAATVGLDADDLHPDFTDLDSLTLTQLHALADVCDVDADDPVRRILSALGEIVGHDGEPLGESLAHLRADILAALRSAVF